jgi:hypothetical protein
MADIQISIINESTVVSDADVQQAVADLQIQVHQHFAPAWGIDADLTFVPSYGQPAANTWWIAVLDNTDQAGALGYHDITPDGLPLGKVFAGTDIQNNLSWTVTVSHELLEMLGDPDINLSMFMENNDGTGTLYAYETCDACEDDQYAYMINNTKVSDFVYPAWFETFRASGTQFDYCNYITAPLQLLPGGYIGVYNITAGTGWTQKHAENASLNYHMRAHVGSRRERRRTPRSQWMKSVKASR